MALGRVSQSCQIIAAAFSSHLTELEGNPCRPRLYNPSPTPSCWLSARSGVGDGVEGPPSCSPSFCRKNQVHAGSGAAPSRSRVPPPPERPRLAPERPRVRPQRLGPGTAGGRVGNTASQAGAVGDPSTPSPPGKQVSRCQGRPSLGADRPQGLALGGRGRGAGSVNICQDLSG